MKLHHSRGCTPTGRMGRWLPATPIRRRRVTATPGHHRVGGFSLVELLVAVGIVGVLLAMAMPAFADYIIETRLGAALSELTADLNLARSDAVKRNARVLVCPKAPGSNTCATVNPNWANGWLVCYDLDSNGVCDVGSTADPNPMRVKSALATGITLTGPATPVTYLAVGSALAAANFTLTSSTSTTRTSAVALSGVIVTAKY